MLAYWRYDAGYNEGVRWAAKMDLYIRRLNDKCSSVCPKRADCTCYAWASEPSRITGHIGHWMYIDSDEGSDL